MSPWTQIASDLRRVFLWDVSSLTSQWVPPPSDYFRPCPEWGSPDSLGEEQELRPEWERARRSLLQPGRVLDPLQVTLSRISCSADGVCVCAQITNEGDRGVLLFPKEIDDAPCTWYFLRYKVNIIDSCFSLVCIFFFSYRRRKSIFHLLKVSNERKPMPSFLYNLFIVFWCSVHLYGDGFGS